MSRCNDLVNGRPERPSALGRGYNTSHMPAPPPTNVPFRAALRVWVRVACLSFGGPAGQIAVMHRILVEEKRWISEGRFLHALNYCMLLPGPEAQQLATYIGWLLHRSLGGLVAGTLFVLPGFLAILALSILYAGFQDRPLVAALFFGLKPAVLAIVVAALARIGSRILKNRAMVAIAAGAFVAIFLLDVPFPLIVLSAALLGLLGGRLWPQRFLILAEHGGEHAAAADAATTARPALARSLGVAALWLALWFLPCSRWPRRSGRRACMSRRDCSSARPRS
jgi:chromate transporter